MASVSSYVKEAQSSTGVNQQTIADIIKALGGTTNPTQDNYTPAEKIAVTQPQLMTIAQYLEALGGEGYQYDYDTILQLMNEASALGQEATQNEINNAQSAFNRSMATNQQTAADTIRNQYAAAIQSGMAKGMQNANMLSTLLGTSQQAAEGAQQLNEQRVQAAKDYAAELAANQGKALTTANDAMNTLFGNIRQLYNDDIQQKTADLEYNASLEETLANYLASKYNADTNYANNVNSAAANSWASLQNALASMGAAAQGAAAQDNYSAAYQAAQQALADSQKYAADKSYAATMASVEAQKAATAAAQANAAKASASASQSVAKSGTTAKTGTTSKNVSMIGDDINFLTGVKSTLKPTTSTGATAGVSAMLSNALSTAKAAQAKTSFEAALKDAAAAVKNKSTTQPVKSQKDVNSMLKNITNTYKLK